LIDYSKQAGSRRYPGDLARTYIRGQYAGPDGRSRRQNCMHQFGFSWAGPWDFKNGATEATEGSALSGLNANIGGKSPASC
jgi:hypothetical protein